MNILHAAARTSSIKRFVMTSSVLATYYPPSDVHVDIGSASYNESSCQLAYTIGDDQALVKSFHVYCATKVDTEKAAWQFIEDEKVCCISGVYIYRF
jgi:nucleoside-diphosphate-sugar epimerase